MTNADRLSQRVRTLTKPLARPKGAEGVVPISIVVPGRNVEATVKRTLDSILAQTSDRWELVFVNDGSTDRTAEIVEATVGGMASVQIIDGPSNGVSAARNLGTELATNDYVLYLDADDWIDSRFIELMGGALAADPSLAGVRCIWAYETPDGRTQAWDDLDLSDFFGAAAVRCPFAIHACVIDRHLVQSLGGFDTDLVVGEDWDLWQRIGRAGGQLDFVPEVMAFYFMRAESVMHCDLVRSQSDLVEVARRGTRPDDRVADPLPRYADGLPADPYLDVEAEALAGTLAVAITTGADFQSFIPPYPPDKTKVLSADQIAGVMHESVAFGSCSLLQDWIELYEHWNPRIREMLKVFTEWLGRPDLIEEVLRELEVMIVRSVWSEDLTSVGRTAVRRVDLAGKLEDLVIEEDVDQLVALAFFDDLPIGFARIPVLDGAASAADLANAVSAHLGPRLAGLALGNLRLARKLVPHLATTNTLKGAARLALDTSWDRRTGSRDTIAQFLRWTAREAASSLVETADDSTLAVVTAEAQDTTVDPGVESDGDGLEPINPDYRTFDDRYGEEYFDGIFEEQDPWLYTSKYEQLKYDQTLELIGERRFGRALELACAEGHFTTQLAPRVDRLIAADISPTALVRAAERCEAEGITDIEFRQVDLRNDQLPPNLDLIVCSEVLYFMESEEALADLAGRFVDALNPGGVLVMAHANLIVDDPDRTGFEWGHEFGARRIGEIVATATGLQHVSTSVAELYRIHLFKKADASESAKPAVEIEIPHAADHEPHISRMALWGGATTTRHDAFANEVSYQVPILMYHRVSPTGNAALDAYRVTPEAFEEQLAYLRANGYYGVSSDEMKYSLDTHSPLPGRAVMFTFDDGYQDFFDYAWPLLRDYDFPATVFVVTDLVGQTAAWDARFGEPPPLMDWDTLRYLHRNGIEIGAHTATHRSLTTIAGGEMLEQERRTREAFKSELDTDVSIIAYPFGDNDELVQTTMKRAGYELGVTTQGWLATVWHNPMALPRVDITNQDDIDVFARKLGQRGEINPLRRGLRVARSLRRS